MSVKCNYCPCCGVKLTENHRFIESLETQLKEAGGNL